MGVVALVSVALGLGLRHYQLSHQKPRAQALATANPTPPPNLSAAQSVVLDWQRYHAARVKVLHDNPQLAAEYKHLLGEIEQHQHEMDTAIIKVDPKIAPVVSQLATTRQQGFRQATAQ